MKPPNESRWVAKLCTLVLAVALWFVIRQHTDGLPKNLRPSREPAAVETP
jgi:hypothetical protein